MHRWIAVAVVAAGIGLGLAPVASADPVAYTECTDPLILVSTTAGEMICDIKGTDDPRGLTLRWAPFGRGSSPLETVVMNSSCGPVGTNGDFRVARSTNNYLVWCVGWFSPYRYPTWELAKP